jgi:hypothetical protein
MRTTPCSYTSSPAVSSLVTGDAAAALDIDLTDDEVTALEEHYVTRRPTYYR